MNFLFQDSHSGLIEDQMGEADLANSYLGGGAISRGCIQVCFKSLVLIFFF